MAKMTIPGGGLYRKAAQDEDVRHKYNDLILSYDAVTLLHCYVVTQLCNNMATLLHSYVITSFTSSLNMYFSSSYFLKFWYSVLAPLSFSAFHLFIYFTVHQRRSSVII